MVLDDRKKKVLEAIVKDYIATAEPVGSRTIARKYNLGVSSATIRNEMADLEEMGLIEQPHTSAGRIPSDKGYRLFVDCLMKKQNPSSLEEAFALEILQKKRREVEEMIQETSRVLSRISSYTSLALIKGSSLSQIEHLQLISIGPRKAVLVAVDQNGSVEHQSLELQEWLTEGDIQSINSVLNRELKRISSNRLTRTVLESIAGQLNRYRDILDQIIGILEAGNESRSGEKVYLGGTLNILNQPEFCDVTRLRSLLGLLEEESFVRNILLDNNDTRGLTVRIGGENKIAEIQDCSLVTATYEVNGSVIGKIGLLGPTRMDYARAIGLIEFMSTMLSEFLEQQYSR